MFISSNNLTKKKSTKTYDLCRFMTFPVFDVYRVESFGWRWMLNIRNPGFHPTGNFTRPSSPLNLLPPRHPLRHPPGWHPTTAARQCDDTDDKLLWMGELSRLIFLETRSLRRMMLNSKPTILRQMWRFEYNVSVMSIIVMLFFPSLNMYNTSFSRIR